MTISVAIVTYDDVQLLVDLSCYSSTALQAVSSSSLLPQLITEIQKDDILVQLNCLELLSRLARAEHGLRYMEDQGVVSHIEGMLARVDTDPLMGLLMPG